MFFFYFFFVFVWSDEKSQNLAPFGVRTHQSLSNATKHKPLQQILTEQTAAAYRQHSKILSFQERFLILRELSTLISKMFSIVRWALKFEGM